MLHRDRGVKIVDVFAVVSCLHSEFACAMLDVWVTVPLNVFVDVLVMKHPDWPCGICKRINICIAF